MSLKEILHTCSNPHVAQAALASIGGDLSNRISMDAREREITPGDHAAQIVRTFATSATESDKAEVSFASLGADQPVLSGFQHILIHAKAHFGREHVHRQSIL